MPFLKSGKEKLAKGEGRGVWSSKIHSVTMQRVAGSNHFSTNRHHGQENSVNTDYSPSLFLTNIIIRMIAVFVVPSADCLLDF